MKLPIQAQPILRTTSAAPVSRPIGGVRASGETSHWDCHLVFAGAPRVGAVDIWWGHTAGDATWACNHFLSECKDSQKGCQARSAGMGPWDPSLPTGEG
jgi:hypothetical protein